MHCQLHPGLVTQFWLDTSSDSDVQGYFSEFDAVQGGIVTESDEELDDGTLHSPIVNLVVIIV